MRERRRIPSTLEMVGRIVPPQNLARGAEWSFLVDPVNLPKLSATLYVAGATIPEKASEPIKKVAEKSMMWIIKQEN